MRRQNKVFQFICVLAGFMALGACSSNEEVIDVEAPPVTQTVYNIKAGEHGYGEPAVLPAFSNSSVEVYSLDGPAPVLDRGVATDNAMQPSNAYGVSKSVEVYPLWEDSAQSDYAGQSHDMGEPTMQGAYVEDVEREGLENE